MRVAKDNFYCSNNFLLLQLNSDGIDDDNIQSLGHGQCVVEQRELFTLCKIPPLRRNFAWGAKYPIVESVGTRPYTERAFVLFSGFKIHLGQFLIWNEV